LPEADVNGQRISYEMQGPQDGEPIVLVMGLGVDRVGWLPQLQALSEHHRVLVFDNRDVGRSAPAAGAYEISDMADDLLGVADAAGLDSFHLVGLSMGGAISQHAALKAPERIRTLTLIVTYAYGAPDRARIWAPMLRRMDREWRLDFLLMMVHSQEFAEGDFLPVVRQAMLDYPYQQDVEAFIRQLEASSRHDVRDRIGTLDIPVQVIGAEHDLMVPVWKSKELAALIPGAELEILEGAGHAVNIERADVLNRKILEFVSK
jgi:pimeloyl-ACP methyl ester carboxylesterase